ncbi:MAG: hypothetical protein R3D46_14565 [Defluviimonas denitrificans]
MADGFLSGLYSVRVGLNRMMLAGAIVTLAGMTVLALVTLAGFVRHWSSSASPAWSAWQQHSSAQRQCGDAVGAPGARRLGPPGSAARY